MSEKLFIKTEADAAVLLNVCLHSLLFECPVDSLSSAVFFVVFAFFVNKRCFLKKKKNRYCCTTANKHT